MLFCFPWLEQAFFIKWDFHCLSFNFFFLHTLTYTSFAQTGISFGFYNACLSWPSTFKTPTVPSIITMKPSARATKLHLIYKPLGCPFDKLSSWMKWLGYWGRLGPCLERSKNELSSWHTGGRKTSNHGWTGGWESRLRGETPVGGQ